MNKNGSFQGVNAWKQQGNLYLWRYTEETKHFPGWHITADAQGCLAILDLLNRVEQYPSSAERTLRITLPTSDIVQILCRHMRWKAPERLKFVYLPALDAEKYWRIEEKIASKVFLTVGTHYLAQLKMGITGIMKGVGDYSIGNQEIAEDNVKMRLWFW
jgi:hypothetical protein